MTGLSGGDREIQDLDGTTVVVNGTVGTSNTNLPTVAGGIISEFNIECLESNSLSQTILVSFNGTDFKTLQPGDSWTWTPKGNLTQLIIKGGAASSAYEAVLNREPT
jgi:hypothetical protein